MNFSLIFEGDENRDVFRFQTTHITWITVTLFLNRFKKKKLCAYSGEYCMIDI